MDKYQAQYCMKRIAIILSTHHRCDSPTNEHLPLPSPMQRRAGKYRCQLLLCAPSRNIAQAAARRLVVLAEALPARNGLSWSIDIDPQDLF